MTNSRTRNDEIHEPAISRPGTSGLFTSGQRNTGQKKHGPKNSGTGSSMLKAYKMFGGLGNGRHECPGQVYSQMERNEVGYTEWGRSGTKTVDPQYVGMSNIGLDGPEIWGEGPRESVLLGPTAIRVRNMEFRDQMMERTGQNRTTQFDKIQPVRENSIKLPKIEIKHFDSQPMNWIARWDLFERNIDKNAKLSNVNKMQYLKV